jgi:hypothetical protein
MAFSYDVNGLLRPVLGYCLSELLRQAPSPTRAALLGYALWIGPFGLSQREAADLAGACIRYIVVLAGLIPAQRGQVARGELSLSSIVNHRRASINGNGVCDLTEHLATASPAERLKAARRIGPKTVWDQMVEPQLGEEPETMHGVLMEAAE